MGDVPFDDEPKNVPVFEPVFFFQIYGLLGEIRIPVSRFSLFINTSFCQTRADVDQMIAIMHNLWDVEPYKSTASIFLKLEILDDMLRPKDEETSAIFDDYPQLSF